jgi:hypothetical protein
VAKAMELLDDGEAYQLTEAGQELRVLTAQEADVCDYDPGFPVGVRVQTTLRRLVQIWRGDKQWSASLREGAVELQGPRALCRALPEWFKLSPFAGVPRPSAQPSR